MLCTLQYHNSFTTLTPHPVPIGRMRLKSASSIDPGGTPLMRQPSALESFTHELANACLSSAPILGIA